MWNLSPRLNYCDRNRDTTVSTANTRFAKYRVNVNVSKSASEYVQKRYTILYNYIIEIVLYKTTDE